MFLNKKYIDAALDAAPIHMNDDGTKEERIRIGTIYCGFDEYGTYLSIDQYTGDIYAVRPVLD